MGRRGRVGLHFGLPVAVGLVMGFNQVRIGAHLTLLFSVLFWTTASLGLWTIFEMVGRAAKKILRPWSLPLSAFLIITMAIASLPGRAFLAVLVESFNPFIVDGSVPRELAPFEPTPEFVIEFIRRWAGFFTFWFSLNLVLNRVFGITRFGFPGQTTMTQPALRPDRVERYNPALARRPQFMDRIPARLGDELLALSAQDHYLEVRTRVGKTLILYALGDAVNQLDEAAIEGMRIHRSHWIARDAVDHISVRGRRHVVVLKDGAELPVGQTYLQLLRRAGFVEHASVTFSPAAA